MPDSLYVGQFTTHLMKPNFHVSLTPEQHITKFFKDTNLFINLNSCRGLTYEVK